MIDLIGYLAAVLTTFSFVPQAIKTFHTRDVSGISLRMYCIFSAGVGLWLVYGWLLAAWPIIMANTMTLSLTIGILLMKLRYRHRPLDTLLPQADKSLPRGNPSG